MEWVSNENNNNKKKNKYEECVEKKMLIFMNAGSCRGPGGKRPTGIMCAGVFEMDFTISTRSVGDENPTTFIEPLLLLDDDDEAAAAIEPMGTFFKQRHSVGPMIASVGACVVGSDLFMIPDEKTTTKDDDDERDRILPWKFNLFDKTSCTFPNFPNATNVLPLVSAIRGQVYVLSLFDFKVDCFPEPCFKLLNPKEPYDWKELSCFPFHREPYRLLGHAVINDCFILVCFKLVARHEYIWYSYNIDSGYWKTVGRERGPGTFLPVMHGECVVIGEDIYSCMVMPPGVMRVISYTCANSEEHDLCLGFVRKVEGLKLDKEYAAGALHLQYRNGNIPGPISGVLGQVEDRILCVLTTLFVDRDRSLHVCVAFLKIEERERCTMLRSFRCLLQVGEELSTPMLKSCIVLNSVETSEQPPSKRAALQDNK